MSGHLLVGSVGPCGQQEVISNEIMARIAGISGGTWEPISYAYDPDAECVGFWVNDETGKMLHTIMDRETFLSRFALVSPASEPPAP